jgi:hypothetical protein
MAEGYKTAGDAEHQHDEPHIVPLIYYFGVFAVLVVGTILTYIVATFFSVILKLKAKNE